MYKKPLIVFEGIEGSGKTSHIKYLANYLRKKRIQFIKIREPGGTKTAEKIRKLLLNKNSKFDKKTDLLLYLAARNENIKKIIQPNYKKKIILIDRFIDSTLAYQHYGMGINYKFINEINNIITKNIRTRITFLNLVSMQNMRKRLMKRKKLNRYDMFKTKFYKKVQNGFVKIAKKSKNKYIYIDSNKKIDLNRRLIIKEINKILK